MNWTLKEILDSTPLPIRFEGSQDILPQPIRAVTIDSRQVAQGDLFVAIKGERFDGHDFLQEVFAKKAVAAVVENSVWQKIGSRLKTGAFLIVPDTLIALQEIAAAYARRIAPKIIALTGSNGKTTTKEMIANVLQNDFRLHKTEGNLNNHIGVPLTLLAMPEQTELAVIEMGMNHLGEIARLCEIAPPDIGLITNIGMAHTEFLKNIDGVRMAKGELFAGLTADGLAVVNADDPNVVRAAQERGPAAQLTYGFRAEAEIRGEHLEIDDAGFATFRCRGKEVRAGVPGLHNAGNALSALALACLFEIDLERAVAALAEPVAVSGRMRRTEIAGRVVIDDAYNANPESMRAALDFLAALPVSGRRIVVLGDMLELGDEALQAHCEVIEYSLSHRNVAHLIVHGPIFQQAMKKVAATAGRADFIADKTEIAHRLSKMTQKGDVLLIKGSRGLKMEEVLAAFEKVMQKSNFSVRE